MGIDRLIEYRLWFQIIDNLKKEIESLMGFPKCGLPSLYL